MGTATAMPHRLELKPDRGQSTIRNPEITRKNVVSPISQSKITVKQTSCLFDHGGDL